MSHKDRATYLAYLDRYRAEHRPSPEAQARNGLPPFGAYEYSDDGAKIRCHVCGRWFGSLNTHVRMHDLDAKAYKDLFDLKRTSSLLSPVAAEKQRLAALVRGQGEIGREHLPTGTTRPKGLRARLQHKIEASTSRKGRNTRAGERTRDNDAR